MAQFWWTWQEDLHAQCRPHQGVVRQRTARSCRNNRGITRCRLVSLSMEQSWQRDLVPGFGLSLAPLSLVPRSHATCCYPAFVLASLTFAHPHGPAAKRGHLQACKPYRAGLRSSACRPSLHDMELQRSLVQIQEARYSVQKGSCQRGWQYSLDEFRSI